MITGKDIGPDWLIADVAGQVAVMILMTEQLGWAGLAWLQAPGSMYCVEVRYKIYASNV